MAAAVAGRAFLIVLINRGGDGRTPPPGSPFVSQMEKRVRVEAYAVDGSPVH